MGLINNDLSSPGTKTAFVTPNDNADLEVFAKSLWINSDGTITGTAMYDSGPQTYTVAAGTPLPIVFKRIFATGTTADFIAILA